MLLPRTNRPDAGDPHASEFETTMLVAPPAPRRTTRVSRNNTAPARGRWLYALTLILAILAAAVSVR